MPLTIINQDITAMAVDAIVNAANTALRMGWWAGYKRFDF
jgi:O-acetyl-ADP-ribose deacetylase (regulator of RNase III)